MCLSDSLSRSVTMPDAHTRPKILKELNRQPLCHDIGELILGWHMENTNLAESHFIMDEMDVDLNVLEWWWTGFAII